MSSLGERLERRGLLIRLIQFFLGLDGLFHVAELVAAIYEGAQITATIAAFQAVVFFLGVYFVGHDHSHHRKTLEEGDGC